jgi:hypothetical protein
MRFIPTRVHGVLDYVVVALLIASPWLFDFADDGAEMWVPIVIGAGVLVYSLFTDYDLSLADIIPMPVHLILDFIGGVVLVASPWVFGFSDEVWIPHVAIGAFEILTALATHTVPDEEVGRDTGRMSRA